MTLQRIDLDKSGTLTEYVFSVELDETEYSFRFAWNRLGSFWSFDLYDVAADPILLGQPVILYTDLLETVADTRKPLGHLFFCHVRAENIAPTLKTLGTDVLLYYSTP